LRKQFPAEEKSVVAVGFNSAGDLLAAACSTGTVKVWRWASAELIRQLPGSAPALALVLHPSRNVVAAGYASGAVALWNIDTNEKKEASLATDRINSLAFTPDGARLAVAAGTAVLLVDSASLAQPRTLGTDPDDVNAVAVDPAGELLAAAGGRGTLRIIEAGSGREVLALVPKTVALTSLAFQPNPTGQSKKLAVGDRAGAVRIYEMNREALIAQARSIVGEARGKGLLPSEGCDPAARGNL
jgi:WD40 repeat protein